MKIITLIALYGDKPNKLTHLISDCQAQITSLAGSAFHSYDVQQIHATIVNIGQTKISTIINTCYSENISKKVEMEFGCLLNFLRSSQLFPFQVQIGGFQDRDYPFVSRGFKPYERSCSFQNGKAVLIGWPIRVISGVQNNSTIIDMSIESQIYPNILNEIRHALKTFGFLHSYFYGSEAIDNDLYFRIGLYDSSSLSEQMKRKIELSVRRFLSVSDPVIIDIMSSNIYIAFSNEETLPINSTKVLRVSDKNVTADSIRNVFERMESQGG